MKVSINCGHLFVFILLYLLVSLILRPLEAGAEDYYRFKHISMEHGLSNNSVFCILQDSLGFLWFGTFSGLNRYDGRTFTVYKPQADDPKSITGSVIFSILEDSKRDLWIGTDGAGLNHYDRDRDCFTNFSHDPRDPGSLSGNQVFAVAEDGMGWIWVGTGGSGLNRYDPAEGVFRRYRKNPDDPKALASDVIRALLEDSFGLLWIGTAGGGLSRYDRLGDDFTTYRADSSNNGALGSDTVRALFEDSKRRLWIGTEKGLYRYDPAADSFTCRLETESTVRSITEDETGRLWAGTESSGLYVFEASGTKHERISAADAKTEGLAGDKIRSFHVDRSGLLWIGTRDDGISVFNPRSRDFAFIPAGHAVRQMTETPSGEFLFGTDGGGFHRLDPRSGRAVPFPLREKREGPGESVYAVLADEPDVLWLGTDGDGLYRVDEKKGTKKRYIHDPRNEASLGSNVVWAICRDSGGTLWIGTEGGGLNRYLPERDGFKRYLAEPKDPASLNGNSVRTIFEDREGTLWIGTWDGGLSRYRAETDDFEQIRRDPGDPSSLGDNSVNCIYQDREGALWVGTAGAGINRQYGKTGKFSHFTKADGLSGDNVFGILEDGEGRLWVSTDNGLSRFDPKTGKCHNFGEADGLQANEFSQNAYYRGRSGVLCFGGRDGISYFQPAAVRGNPTVPPVRITGVTIYDKPVPVGRKIHGYTALKDDITVASSIELSYKDSVVSFGFAVLDYTAPERNQYAMKIEGIHDEWIQLGTKNSAVITSLRPGRYVLKVKGSNNNGLWNEQGASLAVLVHPPFWQTWWFRSFLILTFLLAAFGLYKSRTSALKRRAAQLRNFSRHIQNAREEERKAAAREVHDELGQYLAVLKMELFWMRNHISDGRKLLECKTDEMLGILDKTMDSVKSLATKLRPKALDNLSFSQAVEWLCRDFGKLTGISCRLGLRLEDAVPPPEAATNLFRILQEIFTNVLKHARAANLDVDLYLLDGSIVMQVKDDGIGIPRERLDAEDAFGIVGIRERCAYLGGTVVFEADGGTRVTVTVPYKEETPCSGSS